VHRVLEWNPPALQRQADVEGWLTRSRRFVAGPIVRAFQHAAAATGRRGRGIIERPIDCLEQRRRIVTRSETRAVDDLAVPPLAAVVRWL
jgi:hypothetical protein